MISIPKIGNSAGTCNRIDLFQKLLKSAADTITVGPMSVKPREINPGNNEYRDRDGQSVNSLGLPSHGVSFFLECLPGMTRAAESVGKQLAVSTPPIESGDAEKLAEACVSARIKIMEYNAGCGNVWVGKKQKPILSFDLKRLETDILAILAVITGSIVSELRIKLSPYSDPCLLAEVADMLADKEVTIVTCNTFANAFMFREDTHHPAIQFGKHLGGLGGKGMKAIALGQVAQFRELLPSHRIIGVSGIENGRDLWEYITVGANEVQVGSAWYFTENPRIFGDIQAQYLDIIEQHSV